METRSARRERVCSLVDERATELREFATWLHRHPELSFEESQAMQLLGRHLEAEGFAVEYGVGSLPTALRAQYASSGKGPCIALMAEYDALPGLGHACGHNLIAGIALGAALALARLKPSPPGSLIVLGTPAEENGGGKIDMIKDGVFDNVDVALMVHPGNADKGTPHLTSVAPIEIDFHGKAAHAAVSADQGRSALMAMIQMFNLVEGVRSQMPQEAVVHGIITHGGDRTNIIPEFAQCRFTIRAYTAKLRDELVEMVKRCAQASAQAMGCTVETRLFSKIYEATRVNNTLSRLYLDALTELGREVNRDDTWGRGTSDASNVSQVVPTLQGTIAIGGKQLKAHTTEFASAAASEEGFEGMVTAAKAIALTALDIFERPGLYESVVSEFEGGGR